MPDRPQKITFAEMGESGVRGLLVSVTRTIISIYPPSVRGDAPTAPCKGARPVTKARAPYRQRCRTGGQTTLGLCRGRSGARAIEPSNRPACARDGSSGL
jgi:hypothetical protein